MSAGSDASMLGYGKIPPLSNINGNFVNVDNSHDPAGFGSKVIPGLPGLAGAQNNVVAAKGIVPGICLFKGGAKGMKRKIKNITKQYKKMKGGKKRMRSMKKRIRSKMAKSSSRRRRHPMRTVRRRRHSYRGGYSQYQNNLPLTPTYSVGGVLPASQLGLANPPPITRLPACVNCVDNYNHYTGKGFPSKGH